MSEYTENENQKFEWMVEDPFYSPRYDEEVVVTDFGDVVSTKTGIIVDIVEDSNFEDLYNEWYEFTSQDWDTGEIKAPEPY